jgi:hypothetical protein
MDAKIWAAIIGASAGLCTTLLTLFAARRREKRQQRLNAEQVLARYRDPLITATFHLQQRLFNILRTDGDDIRGYLHRPELARDTLKDRPDPNYRKVLLQRVLPRGRPRRREDSSWTYRRLAVSSTLYRVAEYLAWTEILRVEVQFMNFRRRRDSRIVHALIGDISRSLADDRHGRHFMLWYEEQRAIGEEMMIRDNDVLRCIGYSRFTSEYQEKFDRWFADFAAQLMDSEVPEQRLKRVFDLLLRLGKALDPKESRYRWSTWQERNDAGELVGRLK